MTEAERYLAEKKRQQQQASNPPPLPEAVKMSNNKEVKMSTDKASSVVFAIIGVVATALFMVFFKGCFARM